MKKLLVVALILMLMIPSATAMKVKCKKKSGLWECSIKGMECYYDNKEINCVVEEMPFGELRKKINIFGTEYSPGQSARTFLQLLDSGSPVNNALCLIDFYKPDNSVWFDDVAMMYLNNSDGLYYFDFIAPNQDGIYMMTVRCFYVVDRTYDYADDGNVVYGTVVQGDYTDTWKDDNEYHSVNEKQVSGGYRFEIIYDFYNLTIPQNYTGMTVYWIGRWRDSGESVLVEIWNWCNSSWVELPNEITTNTPFVSNFLDSSWDVNCLVTNGTVKIMFRDSDWNEKVDMETFSTDFLDVQMSYLTFGSMETIRGGGEVHVSNPLTQQESLVKLINFFEYTSEDKVISNHDYCVNNTHRKVLTVEKCGILFNSTVCFTINKTIDEVCNYGCENGKCVEAPYIVMLKIAAGICVVIAFVFILGRARL